MCVNSFVVSRPHTRTHTRKTVDTNYSINVMSVGRESSLQPTAKLVTVFFVEIIQYGTHEMSDIKMVLLTLAYKVMFCGQGNK